MFTGIIQAVGHIERLESRGEDMRLWIGTGALEMGGVAIGDSIAVNGVCLTAVSLDESAFSADVSAESLKLTTLGELKTGTPVNLEKALTLSTPLGGHLVSGHVDGLGTVVERRPEGRSERFLFEAPPQLARYIAPKGSICINGVSLTVNSVDGGRFDVNLVPHTLDVTTLQHLRSGSRVNLEVDIIARYLERLLQGKEASSSEGITMDFLEKNGFIKG